MFKSSFQLNNPDGIENLSTVPNTINEMLCMGHGDVVRVFPAVLTSLRYSQSQTGVESILKTHLPIVAIKTLTQKPYPVG